MITEEQLLGHFQGVDRSMGFLREAILTLHNQNLQLLQMIADLERRPEGVDLGILANARRDYEKHRPA